MTAQNTAVAQKPKFSAMISTAGYQRLINNTLGDPERSRRFVAAITSAVAVNPALQECEPGTILAGALLGESLNLSPSPQLGQYYLVPFEQKLKGPDGKTAWVLDENGKHVLDSKGKWMAYSEKRAQFVIGFKGYLQLAIRSGQYRDIDVMEVRDGEYLGKDPTTGKPRFQFIENDDEREARPVIGYLAYFEYLNGFRKTLFWSKQKMMNHADQNSPAFSALAMQQIEAGQVPPDEMWKYSSFWYKDFDAMAKKTMLRQLISKWGIMSIDMQQAYVQDSKFIQMDDGGGFVGTPEEAPQVEQQQPVISQPEVTDAVEQVNLADL